MVSFTSTRNPPGALFALLCRYELAKYLHWYPSKLMSYPAPFWVSARTIIVIANILPGKPMLWGNPTLNRENGWATSCWPHLDLQFCYICCGARLTETRNTEVQDCIGPTASDPEWKVSFPHHSWSLKKQAVHRGSHSGQCAILCHDRHWPWRNTDLCDTAEHFSTMFIFMYDHPLWWKSIIIIKNKPKPRHLHGNVLRLGGFHTLISFLQVVDHIMAG